YDKLHAYSPEKCTVCHELWPTNESHPQDSRPYTCERCSRDARFLLRNPSTPQVGKFSFANGMIPRELVPELQGLTVLEQQLIALAHPIARAYRLPGGQRGFSGHILNVARDITSFATSLPWRADSDEVPVVVIVPPQGGNWEGREFTVSRRRVETALVWLIANNSAFSNVRVYIENLAALGTDRNDDTERDLIGNFLRLDESARDPAPAADGGGGRAPTESFVPTDGSGANSEEEAVRAALQRMAAARDATRAGDAQAMVDHPRQMDPLPEHRTPYLATKCFPCLFPYGAADPTVRVRARKVDFVDHISHLLKFVDVDHDGRMHYRFASHRLFAYWCMDTKVRGQARTQCRVYMQNNPQTAEMSVDDVFDQVRDNVSSIMAQMTRYSANLPGTDAFWLKEQGRLENAVDQLQSLTVFTTYSAADHHWYDLHRLMPGYKEDVDPLPTPQQRTQWLIDNPHLADWWFWQRLKEWKSVFLGRSVADARWHWDRAEWQSRASLHAHGCSSWDFQGRAAPAMALDDVADMRLTNLSRTYLKGFLARRQAGENRLEVGAAADGGVSDEEFLRVQQEICTFLVGVGFTARNPDPPLSGEAASEEQQRAATEGLSRDMRAFPWEDEEQTQARYSLLLDACQRHTRCGTYCLRGGTKCRFGYPHPRQDTMQVKAHCLVSPPTDRVEDWQVVVLPPRSSEGEEEHDGFVNRHVVVQLLAWGGNVDASFIVDRGMAYRYMAKYASKGESRSKEAQRILTEMINEAHAQPEDDRPHMGALLQRTMMRATTRRDMGCQEVMHNLLQMESVLHNLAFATVDTEDTTVELNASARCTTLLQGYQYRLESRVWSPTISDKPSNDILEAMSYAEFAAQFFIPRTSARQIKRIASDTNRVVTFKPWGSSNPAGDRYPDYCRNSLVRFKPWSGELSNGWGGLPGELACTDCVVARDRMVVNWVAFATPMLRESIQPPGFSARDLHTARRIPRRRSRRRGEEGHGDRSNDEEGASDDDEWEDDDHLDGVHGEARPGDHSEVRQWQQDPEHDWSANGWVGQAAGPQNAASWVRDAMRRGSETTVSSTATVVQPPTLNEKQALAVDVVRSHANQLDEYRLAVRRGTSPLPPLAEPLRMVLTGTAGTGKTVVINEMVRLLGEHRFKLLAPTGCAACGIGGQTIHSGSKIPVKKKSSPNADGSEMSNNAKNDLQRRMAGVDYILVDEMSMVGQDLLGLMSIRGRQAVQGRPIEGDDDRHLGMFGGLNVILVGDPMQLPPVGASPMWSDKPGTSGHTVEGRAVWLAINAAVELTEVMRQMGEENAAFRRALLAVAEGRATQEHFELFVSRMRSVVPEAEHARFLEAVHLFPTNAKADDWNWTRLNNLRAPIALIRAKHSVSPGYANVSADRFRGLDPHLYLAVGARVFITSNVWTSAGLANGATGIIIHIDWAAGGDSIRPPGVPAVLYVKLKDFKGPQYFTVASRVINGQTVYLKDVVPIAPIEAQDERGPAANVSGQRGARCVRRQMPVRLAFGVTHHKSQGGTLDVVVLDLGERENNDGQSFTALSRCRDLQNMVLEDFTLERLTTIGDSPSFAARLAALDRLREIENDTRLKF
ncbi:unnamed protein product, partial [Scytosiphon promiscuus]